MCLAFISLVRLFGWIKRMWKVDNQCYRAIALTMLSNSCLKYLGRACFPGSSERHEDHTDFEKCGINCKRITLKNSFVLATVWIFHSLILLLVNCHCIFYQPATSQYNCHGIKISFYCDSWQVIIYGGRLEFLFTTSS